MNKPNVRKWVKALRSGKYKQAEGVLHNHKDNAFCCLGIVCVLAGLKPTKRRGLSTAAFEGESGYLPPSAQKWLGIKEGNPFIGTYRAAELNDTKRLSFKKIADRIERRWLSA